MNYIQIQSTEHRQYGNTKDLRLYDSIKIVLIIKAIFRIR